MCGRKSWKALLARISERLKGIEPMRTKLLTLICTAILIVGLGGTDSLAQTKKAKATTGGSPGLYDKEGNFLGNVNRNQYDPNSISNPYGTYGSPYSPKSVNNAYGKYGSPYSSEGVTNPYGSTNSPRVIGSDGEYLGRMNANKYDAESTSNPYGAYGSPYSSKSINNPYSVYGNPYSPNSATNPYGSGSGKKKK
jgi:hypothetical protein